MRVNSVDAPRTRSEPSKPSMSRHEFPLTLHVARRTVLLVARLALAALAAGAVAQDSHPGSTAAAPVSTQQPASSGATGATVTSQDSTSSPTAQPQTEEGQFVFKKKVEEVVLHAIVVDPQNRLMSNLNRDAFHVFENGKLQRMTSFRHENVPLALGILIDNSGSMRPKRQKVNEAALNLVGSSNTQDEMFVVNFGEEYYLDQDFTGDVPKLKAALDKVETRGSTALYDAIVASAAHIRRDARIQKRVLLVVTDGKDNASQESLDETVEQLQQADGPIVYVIAFVDETKGASATIRALQAISMNTGGTAYFPKDLNEVDAITKSIANDIRDQYVIGYKSSNPMAGHAYHAIDVQANDGTRHKLRVRTRTGYYSEEPAASQ
jgi:Ca-activated chloride channel family protein